MRAVEGAFTPGGFGPAQSGAHVGSGEGLRPLRVGEVLDAATKLYRRNAVDLWKIVACVVVPVLLIRRQQRRAIVDRLACAQRQQSGPEAQADRVAERAAGLGGCCVALERLRGVSGCQVGAGTGLERGVEAALVRRTPRTVSVGGSCGPGVC